MLNVLGTPQRVLHIVENLDNQATESWLLNALARVKVLAPGQDWSFYCTLGKPGANDDRAIAYGARVCYSPYPIGETYAFMRHLRRVIKSGGFDVVHCHHDIVSAIYLVASAGLGVRARVVHIHNAAGALPTPSLLKRAILHEPMRRLCLGLSDFRIGVSRAALASILGDARPGPWDTVMYCGIDLTRFAPSKSAQEIRPGLGVPTTAVLMLFAGRLVDYKNPLFVLDVLKELTRGGVEAAAVFAGTGPLDRAIGRRAVELKVEAHVRVLGFRRDLPVLMQASDVLLWPSLENPMEGLGLGVVEAQAAGLPVVMSRSVPNDAVVVPELTTTVPLHAGAAGWASIVQDILSGAKPSREESLARVSASSFALDYSVEALVRLYQTGTAGARPKGVGARVRIPGAAG
jgi:glycosyltransferase involved in cell wall biosynthesis